MVGRRDLSILHTPLQIGLFAGKCSPVLCVSTPMFLWRKNTRLLEPSGLPFPHAAQEVGLSGSICSAMLCVLRTAMEVILQTNEWLPVFSRPCLSFSICYNKRGMGRRPMAKSRPCPFYHFLSILYGGMGACPHVSEWPLTFPFPQSPQKKDRAKALSFFFKNPEPSECSPASRSPCARRAGWRPDCRG